MIIDLDRQVIKYLHPRKNIGTIRLCNLNIFFCFKFLMFQSVFVVVVVCICLFPLLIKVCVLYLNSTWKGIQLQRRSSHNAFEEVPFFCIWLKIQYSQACNASQTLWSGRL